ncbi:MAG: hypothetical protein Q8O90_08135 [Elusimicrobiota bacterium]|nr:hypothetical protein [Elusimicrobiota bacterium]
MKSKKVLSITAALLLAVSVSHAMRWGAEFTGTNWKMDTTDLGKDLDYRKLNGTTGELGKKSVIAKSAAIFMEGGSKWRLGFSAGFGSMSNHVYTTVNPSYTNFMDRGVLENEVSYIPVSLYLKYKPENSRFSLSGGGGADYITASTKIQDDLDGSGNPQANTHKGTFTQKKIVPHVQAGAEWFMFKWLSLNVSAKYLFSAVFDDLTGNLSGSGVSAGKQKLIMSQAAGGERISFSPASAALASGDRPFRYDFSGARINAALRIYFK